MDVEPEPEYEADSAARYAGVPSPPAPAGAGAWSRAVTGLLAFIIYVYVQQRWWGVLVGHGMQGGHAGWWWECG